MQVPQTKPLFAWDCLEDRPSLSTIRELLASVPDGELLASLRGARGKGRDDYPVGVLWGVVLLTVALRHVTIDATLNELRRNPALRRLTGIETEDGVPRKWNMSRFLVVLGREPRLSLLREVFDAMVKRLGTVVSELGVHTAGDSTGLSARADGDSANADGLPQAVGGKEGIHRRAGERGARAAVVRLQAAPAGRHAQRGGPGLSHHVAQGRRQRAAATAGRAGPGESAQGPHPDAGP